MASDGKKDKVEAPVKSEAVTTDKSPSGADATKTAASEPAAAPANYSRGEGQKAVTAAYKENWNAIFGKKSKKKKR
jgi:hypothetical protein